MLYYAHNGTLPFHGFPIHCRNCFHSFLLSWHSPYKLYYSISTAILPCEKAESLFASSTKRSCRSGSFLNCFATAPCFYFPSASRQPRCRHTGISFLYFQYFPHHWYFHQQPRFRCQCRGERSYYRPLQILRRTVSCIQYRSFPYTAPRKAEARALRA